MWRYAAWTAPWKYGVSGAVAALVVLVAVAGALGEEDEETEAESVLSRATSTACPPEPKGDPTAGGEQSIETPEVTATPAGDLASVVEVIDGDTIRVSIAGRVATVRYIDTPETRDPNDPVECFGAEASVANTQLVAGNSVRLEKDVSETDRFDRLLRYVYVGDEMVNERLVRDGFAVSSTFPPDVKYQDRFLTAQQEARAANRGLWAACGGADTPLATATIPPPPSPVNGLPPTTPSGNCHPSYAGACLLADASDYDCREGNGNGPYYTGEVIVVGPDVFDLDRDRDGIGYNGQ